VAVAPVEPEQLTAAGVMVCTVPTAGSALPEGLITVAPKPSEQVMLKAPVAPESRVVVPASARLSGETTVTSTVVAAVSQPLPLIVTLPAELPVNTMVSVAAPVKLTAAGLASDPAVAVRFSVQLQSPVHSMEMVDVPPTGMDAGSGVIDIVSARAVTSTFVLAVAHPLPLIVAFPTESPVNTTVLVAGPVKLTDELASDPAVVVRFSAQSQVPSHLMEIVDVPPT